MNAPIAPRKRSPVVAAARHAIDVLRTLSSASEPLGVSEVARRIGLHKSSVSRLLHTLEEAHLVEREQPSNRFRLGIGLISLAAPLLSDLRLLDVAKPVLEDLARTSGETVSLNVWDGEAAVSIHQVPGGNAIRHFAPPGMRNPPHCTAAGKILLAHMTEAEVKRVLQGALAPFTERTKVDAEDLMAELATIRLCGYALNEGELEPDVGAVASVIRNIDGVVVAAMVATVPMYRFEESHRTAVIEQVQSAAASVSRRLGHS